MLGKLRGRFRLGQVVKDSIASLDDGRGDESFHRVRFLLRIRPALVRVVRLGRRADVVDVVLKFDTHVLRVCDDLDSFLGVEIFQPNVRRSTDRRVQIDARMRFVRQHPEHGW